MGSVIGSEQLAEPYRFAHILATGKIGLYLVDGATRRLLDWPVSNVAWRKPERYDGAKTMASIIALWGARADGGIFEGGLFRAITPNVPPEDYHSFADSESNAEFKWFAAGWHPHIAMLNLSFNDHARLFGGSYHNPSSEFTDRDVSDTAVALSDTRRTTGAGIVLPYISNAPQGHVSATSDTDAHGNPGLGSRVQSNFATDPFYARSRHIACLAGGFGLDTPANIFSTDRYFGTNHSEMFRRLIASELRWANKNHLVTVVFMTIFDVRQGHGGNSPDIDFMRGVRMEVDYLKQSHALPTYWAVGQYSNGPADTNKPDTDTTPNSISSVADWVARHAPTSVSRPPDLTCCR